MVVSRRCRLLTPAFVVVVLSVWVGSHVYLARALVLDADLPAPLEALGIVALVLLGATVVAQPIAERLVAPERVRPLNWVAAFWMGFAFLAMLLLGLVVNEPGETLWPLVALAPFLFYCLARPGGWDVLGIALLPGCVTLVGHELLGLPVWIGIAVIPLALWLAWSDVEIDAARST